MGTGENSGSYKPMPWKRSWAILLCLASVCMGLFSTFVTGQTTSSQHAGHHGKQTLADPPAKGKPDKFVIPDLVVSDQNGKKRKFYTDLVKNKKVIVNFVFTSCTKICPATGSHFSKLQKTLGNRLGTDVFLITITTDPVTDTPERFKAWGEKYHPAPGWTLVTGSVENITRLLQLFTGDGVNTGYHVPSICIVDDIKKSQTWTYGLAPFDEIIRTVDRQ